MREVHSGSCQWLIVPEPGEGLIIHHNTSKQHGLLTKRFSANSVRWQKTVCSVVFSDDEPLNTEAPVNAFHLRQGMCDILSSIWARPKGSLGRSSLTQRCIPVSPLLIDFANTSPYSGTKTMSGCILWEGKVVYYFTVVLIPGYLALTLHFVAMVIFNREMPIVTSFPPVKRFFIDIFITLQSFPSPHTVRWVMVWRKYHPVFLMVHFEMSRFSIRVPAV